jgi:hypothetical protein
MEKRIPCRKYLANSFPDDGSSFSPFYLASHNDGQQQVYSICAIQCGTGSCASTVRYPILKPSRKPTTKLPANGKREITLISHENAEPNQLKEPDRALYRVL